MNPLKAIKNKFKNTKSHVHLPYPCREPSVSAILGTLYNIQGLASCDDKGTRCFVFCEDGLLYEFTHEESGYGINVYLNDDNSNIKPKGVCVKYPCGEYEWKWAESQSSLEPTTPNPDAVVRDEIRGRIAKLVGVK